MDRGKDPYPWLEDDDPRRNMTDQDILEKYIDLSDSDLNSAEKRSLYKVLVKYKDAFSLSNEIGLCPIMEIELELNDETPFFIRPFPIKENEKDVVDKEMRKGCMLGIIKKGMSSYRSPIILIPRRLTGIPRIVTDFRHLNSRLVTLQPSIPLVRDAIQILGSSGSEVLSLALKRYISYIKTVKEITEILWNHSLLWIRFLPISKIRYGSQCITSYLAEIHSKSSSRNSKLQKEAFGYNG